MGAALVWIACVIATLLQAQRAPVEQMVLLPNADGKASAVIIRTGAAETVLDHPYRVAAIDAAGRVRVGDGDPVALRGKYAATLDALPQPAAVFLLYFDTATETLVPESAARLDQIKAQLARRPAPEILVIGHTDTVGGAGSEANDALSLRRAQSVRQLLIEVGIPAEQIVAQARGGRELMVATKAGIDEPQNRRVEIRVR
jgi:outer membrane protein OmpA-like peptidoglycan-associated protein